MDENEESWSTCNMRKLHEKRNGSQQKKKRRKTSTICTEYCRFAVISRIAKIFNMGEVGTQDDWDVCWTDSYIPLARTRDMTIFQRVNHFPGMSAICRKDRLARNLNRMVKLFPKDYNFYPKTWCLTGDLEEVLTYSKNHRNTTYILKPDIGCRGKGIFLTKTPKDLKSFEKMICQVYISKPFVMDGLKFDLRIYVLITSCDPLRIYVYNEGLARFATSTYCEPDADNSTNIYMHLTNYSVNKNSRMFVVDDKAGSKRRISTVNAWLCHNNHNVPKIWAGIDDIIVKTLISAYPTLKRSYYKCFPDHKYTYACFELLGFDVLLDNKLKPHLLEVNHSPSFNTEADLDKKVKESLLKDTFRILNLSKCNKKCFNEEDKQHVQNSQMQDIQKKGSPVINESTLSSSSPSETQNIQMMWEEKHLGNYRQVYPSTDADKYSTYFNQTQNSLFEETVTSRAKGEAGKLQQEEFEVKMPEETAGMSGLNSKLIKSESMALQKPKLKNIHKKKKLTYNPLDPTPIFRANEKNRLQVLAQRESLLRSYRVIDQMDSGKNTKETILKPPVPIKKAQGKEELYLNDHWKTKINNYFRNAAKKNEDVPGLTTEATVRLRPGDHPKTTNTSCPSSSLQHCQTAKRQGTERQLCVDKKASRK